MEPKLPSHSPPSCLFLTSRRRTRSRRTRGKRRWTWSSLMRPQPTTPTSLQTETTPSSASRWTRLCPAPLVRWGNPGKARGERAFIKVEEEGNALYDCDLCCSEWSWLLHQVCLALIHKMSPVGEVFYCKNWTVCAVERHKGTLLLFLYCHDRNLVETGNVSL